MKRVLNSLIALILLLAGSSVANAAVGDVVTTLEGLSNSKVYTITAPRGALVLNAAGTNVCCGTKGTPSTEAGADQWGVISYKGGWLLYNVAKGQFFNPEGSFTEVAVAADVVKLQLADGSIYGHEGKVTKMSGVIDQATGSVQLIALFQNPEKLLKSGGAGTIIIPRLANDVIIIPQSCVSEVQNKKFVYLLGSDNKVKYSEIKVDAQNDGVNYIVTEGLKTGDKYVTNGITKLTDGMEIKPITPERYQQKISEQAKAMSAGDIVNSIKK